MTAKKQPDLTPTEELIIDVLVARFRLGDTLWTFDLRNAAALRRLESRGLINRMGGIVENTERAWLTEKALLEHGHSWFQMETTERYLPRKGCGWTRQSVQHLIDQSIYNDENDPRAVNACHLLMIRMIARNLPEPMLSPAENGGLDVDFVRGRIEIHPGGLSYRLIPLIGQQRTTTDRDEVLEFAESCRPPERTETHHDH